MREKIKSRQNPRIKTLVRLRERRARRELGLFIVEGRRELGHALAAGVSLEELYLCPELFPQSAIDASDGYALPEFLDALAAALPASAQFELSREAFEKASLRESPDGILALGRTWQKSLADLVPVRNPCYAVIESVEKPGNLGAILRTADAAGVDAVFVCDPVLDAFNPNVIRSSQGLCFRLALISAAPEEIRGFMTGQQVSLFATTPDGEASLWDIDLSGPVCLLLGSEKAGLTPSWLDSARRVSIPMFGRTDSLNLAASAAVCFYETARQRRT